jgi:methionyl aminopeptidase
MLIKTPEEIQKMTASGKILRIVIAHVANAAKEEVTLLELDTLAEKLTRQRGATPAFLNYKPHGAKKPYPKSICASINEVAVHAVPTAYRLKSGDILKLDFGATLDGYCSDSAVTVSIGKITDAAQKLIEVTKKALVLGIKQMKPGNHLGDIGYAIHKYVTENNVWNFGRRGDGIKLEPGMVFAIEPMVALGSGELIQLADDSYATLDGSLTAHFEHTVAVTERGQIILT